jgi:hypothetical protein
VKSCVWRGVCEMVCVKSCVWRGVCDVVPAHAFMPFFAPKRQY